MSQMFKFGDWELPYLKHAYNRTSENMRTIEIPIAIRFLSDHEGANILEVGNVLAHYFPTDWPAIDAQEKGRRVINADIMTWRPEQNVDVIVSISTLEHIGHGRYANLTAPGVTPARALSHILSWLKPGGQALLTVPLGYNRQLDEQLLIKKLPVTDVRCMRRISRNNEWQECPLVTALDTPRPSGYRWSAAMAVLYGAG